MKVRSKANRWIHMASSAVAAVRYRPRLHRLEVQFSGSPDRYEYDRIPRSKFRRFLRAESKGAFLNSEIKPKHPCRKLVAARKRTARPQAEPTVSCPLQGSFSF